MDFDVQELLRQMMMGQGLDSSAFSTGFAPDPQSQWNGGTNTGTPPRPGAAPQSYTRTVSVTLRDLYQGATKRLKLKHGSQSRMYSVELKPHYKSGTKITFNASKEGFPKIVFMIQEQDPFYSRLGGGNDVRFEYPVSAKELRTKAVGGLIPIEIPLLDGTTMSRKIRTSTLAAGRLSIPEQGMPSRDGKTRGSLVVEFY